MRTGYWQHLTPPDFDHFDVERTIAVLPVAAIEQHGPHLPLATDALINAGIIGSALPRVADDVCALILPALAYGTSTEHEDYAGTLSVEPELLLNVWLGLAHNVVNAGIRKLVILNTHGGQRQLVDQLALKLRVERDVFAVRCNYFAFGAPPDLFAADEWAHGLHGGELETSLMLHLHPELVRKECLANFESLAATLAARNRWLGVEKPMGFGWKARDLNPAGVAGNAARADAESGAAYLDYLASCFAELLSETAATPLGIIADTY